MSLLVKAGIVGGLGTSVVVPIALTSSTGAKSVGLLDLDSPKEIEKQTPPKNTLEAFSRAGYRKKNGNELADFNKDRETYDGGNFALGCHRLLFGGKNVRKFVDHNVEATWVDGTIMNDHLGKNESDPVLGCSTASVMAWGSEDAYEYELAVKRGDKGFLERITVWKTSKKAISQLAFYKKIQNSKNEKEYSWVTWYGIQRKVTDTQNYEIGNPKDGTWTDLVIENISKDKPNYFAVWVGDNGKISNGKSMFEGLGIKTKWNTKLFSSIAKADDKNNWNFNVFGTTGSGYYTNIKTYQDNIKKSSKYTSRIVADVESFRGSWQDVKEFCASQEGKEQQNLPHADAERLRDYCYTNQTNKK